MSRHDFFLVQFQKIRVFVIDFFFLQFNHFSILDYWINKLKMELKIVENQRKI